MPFSSNIIYLKDREGRYLLGNASFFNFCGKTPEEVIGITDTELYPPETAKIFQAADELVWRDQTAHTMEEIVPHKLRPQTYRSVKFPLKDKSGTMLAIGGISTDITDLTTAYEDLASKERLLRNLIEVQEKEQQFICYEFHDGLIQYATGSLMALESLPDKDLPPASAQIIGEVIKYLRAGIADGRRVIRGSRPTVLDDMGVKAAIEDLIDLLSTADFTIDLEFDPEIGQLPTNLATTIYRVVQEALNNTRKHSGSPRARITVKQVQNDLHIQVLDFGCGFEQDSAHQSGFGLLGMSERVRLLGGQCQIESTLGTGTTVSIRLPLESNTASEHAN